MDDSILCHKVTKFCTSERWTVVCNNFVGESVVSKMMRSFSMVLAAVIVHGEDIHPLRVGINKNEMH